MKVEIFTAIDAIDDTESVFAIYSRNGVDVAFNCLPSSETTPDEMIEDIKSGDYFLRWTDNPEAPRRADMENPVLVTQFIVEE